MTKILFCLLAIFSLVSLSTCCIHDKLQSNLKIYPYPTTPKGRLLEVQERENIRIYTAFYIDDAPAEVKKTIQQQLVPAAISYYQAALKVNPISLPLKLSDADAKDCAEVFSTEALRNGVEADLILLVAGENKPNENYMAYAMACQQEESSQRPIIGMLRYNYAYSFDKKTDFSYQNQISTTLHEIGHILGFSSDLYASYIDPMTGKTLENPTETKEVNGVPITVLDVEPLTSKLRTYFNCPTLEGAYLEQQGDSGNIGSHFERRVFYNEFLTAGDIIDPRISEFFLAVLEGSGWYTPDYTMSEPLFWGKGKGCEFLNTKCIDENKESAFPDHFCSTLGADSCTFGNQAYAMCGMSDISQKDAKLNPAFNYFGDNTIVDDAFSDNCPYYVAYSQSECRDSTNTPIHLPTGEYFGEGSRCFTGTLGEISALEEDSPLCLKKFCQEINTDQYQVIVQVGNSTNVTCTEEVSIEVPGFEGVLNCPDPKTFCMTSALGYCPRGCMGRGTCQNNKCICKDGFYGSDCSYQIVKEKSEDDHKLAVEIGLGIAVVGLLFLGIVVWIVRKVQNPKAKTGEANEKCPLIHDKKGIKSTMIGENQFAQEKDRPVELNMEGY